MTVSFELGGGGGGPAEEGMEARLTRFDAEIVEAFNNSPEGRGLIMSFFFFSLFYMWPYQTMAQMQNFLVEQFPEERDTAGFVMMICATWPMFITHTLLVFTGLGRRLPYGCKVAVPCLLVVALSVYLLIILHSGASQGLLLNSLYGVALLESVAESFTEPAVYDMAGLLPSMLPSQSVQAGNGACGLIVSCVQLLTRLAANGLGPISKEQLKVLTTVFIALMGLTSLAIVFIYKWKVQPSQAYQKFIKEAPNAQLYDRERSNSSVPPAAGRVPSGEGQLTQGAVFAATFQACRHVWASCLAVSVTFVVSLTLWPVIPGRSCVGEGHDTLQSWWFDLIILSFNLADYIGKNARASLQWGARVLSPQAQLYVSIGRAVIFVPLILTCSAPQMYPASMARFVVFISVFLLGLSNGWLSTVCFMRAPKALPPGTPNSVAEQASTVLVIGLFLGISIGCLISYQLGQTVLKDSLGVCYGS